MKMEVLSVQNQYQGQFGVIGSSKVKEDCIVQQESSVPGDGSTNIDNAVDGYNSNESAHRPSTSQVHAHPADWTSPLTPPPPPASASANNHTTNGIGTTAAHNQRNQQQQQLQQRSGSYTESLPGGDNTQGVDVVDGGRTPQLYQPVQPHQQQQHSPPQRQHYYHNNHHYGVTHYNQHNHQQQQQQQHHYNNHQQPHHSTQQKVAGTQQQQQQPFMEAVPADPTTNGEYVYNNNLFCYEDHTLAAAARFGSACHDIDVAAVNELAQRVQAELRAAKSRHLACTEVSLPYDLMPRIAEEIIQASEREPCGVRGCSLYIDFEDEPNNVRRIASFKVDPNTVSTFELYLTLKQDKSGWTSLLPQFLKNLTRSNTILISPAFTLTKNKLYSCD